MKNLKLQTDRLILRYPNVKDFNFLKSMWESGKVMKYVGFPNGLEQSDKKIESWIENWNTGDILRLIIEDKQTGKPIGETGYRRDDNYPFSDQVVAAPDIKLMPDFWGKGLATEALEKLFEYIFNETEIKVIQVTPNVKNKKAIELYQKLGFKKKGQPITCDLPDEPVEYQYMELGKVE